MWFVVLVNVITGQYGLVERLSYTTEAECNKKIEYVSKEFQEWNNGDWELRCINAYNN